MNKATSLFRHRDVYRIRLKKQHVSDDFQYRRRISFLDITFREEGFYEYHRFVFHSDPWVYIKTEDINPDRYIVKGHVVIEKASVEIHTQKNITTQWFDTNEQATTFVNEIRDMGGKWIEIQED